MLCHPTSKELWTDLNAKLRSRISPWDHEGFRLIAFYNSVSPICSYTVAPELWQLKCSYFIICSLFCRSPIWWELSIRLSFKSPISLQVRAYLAFCSRLSKRLGSPPQGSKGCVVSNLFTPTHVILCSQEEGRSAQKSADPRLSSWQFQFMVLISEHKPASPAEVC